MCLIHAAALVANFLEKKPYLPEGCVAFEVGIPIYMIH